MTGRSGVVDKVERSFSVENNAFKLLFPISYVPYSLRTKQGLKSSSSNYKLRECANITDHFFEATSGMLTEFRVKTLQMKRSREVKTRISFKAIFLYLYILFINCPINGARAALTLTRGPIDSFSCKNKSIFYNENQLEPSKYKLDESRSDCLGPFLTACGAPSMIAPLFGKYLNKMQLHVKRTGKDIVSIIYQKKGLKMPIKLETDATYRFGSKVDIQTPRGIQVGILSELRDDFIHVSRIGPSSDESVDEKFTMQDDGSLILSLMHVRNQKVTSVRRVYSRLEE